MTIHEYPLSWYVDKLKNKEFFSMGMYGDGEWVAILGQSVGGRNAEETVYTPTLCKELADSLHFDAPDFLFSTPAGLHHVMLEKPIEGHLRRNNLTIEFVEKDMWDRAARTCQLGPFIKQLRQMDVVVVSNKALRGLHFLNYKHFVEVSYPNCHKEVDRAVEDCLTYGKPAVYLVSMGLPAALFVQKLHGKIPESFILDVGSIWDAFVGIGSQRGWRAELYGDEEAYNSWMEESLRDI